MLGGSDSFRYFKIISVNNKKVNDEGRYKTKGSPGDAAKKAFTQLSKKYKKNKLTFSIKETTQGSNKKEYGPYLGEKIKLKKPLEVKYNGKNKPVMIKYEIKIHLVKKHKQKGGNNWNPSNITEFLQGPPHPNANSYEEQSLVEYQQDLDLDYLKSLNMNLVDGYLIEQGINKLFHRLRIIRWLKYLKENNFKVEGPFTGGSDPEIQRKLIELYNTHSWDAGVDKEYNDFFYIFDETKTDIIAAVRICNSNTGPYKLELGYDLIREDYRSRNLYSDLLKARLKYIMDTKMDMYVLYTTEDRLRDKHIKQGMTWSPKNKVNMNGTNYWRLEYNRPFDQALIQFRYSNNDTASGLLIGNDSNNNGVIYTCLHNMLDKGDNVMKNYLDYGIISPPTSFAFQRADYDDLATRNPRFVDNNLQPLQIGNNQIKWNSTAEKDTFCEEVDDHAIIYTNNNIDTSNIYILDNVEDLPNGTPIKIWGCGRNNCRFKDQNLTLEQANITNYSGFSNRSRRQNINMNNETSEYYYKKFFRIIGNPNNPIGRTLHRLGGDSGGPHYIEFGLRNKKIALIGHTLGGSFSPNASRRIEYLQRLGVKINIAHYNEENNKIEIVYEYKNST